MKKVLLLNSDWSPLNFVTPMRAIKLMMNGRAEVIDTGEGKSLWSDGLQTVSRAYKLPATLRLTHRVNKKYLMPKFRKWVLFNRDGWQCQYCGVSLNPRNITIDHITPRARGGPTTWRNCVASCAKCNSRKGSRALSESGMQLRRPPAEPKVMHFFDLNPHTTWHPDWNMFFGDT